MAKEQIREFLLGLQEKGSIEEKEFTSANEWLDNNYNALYLNFKANRQELFEDLKMNPNRLTQSIAFIDLCIEQKCYIFLNELINEPKIRKIFRDNINILDDYHAYKLEQNRIESEKHWAEIERLEKLREQERMAKHEEKNRKRAELFSSVSNDEQEEELSREYHIEDNSPGFIQGFMTITTVIAVLAFLALGLDLPHIAIVGLFTLLISTLLGIKII